MATQYNNVIKHKVTKHKVSYRKSVAECHKQLTMMIHYWEKSLQKSQI